MRGSKGGVRDGRSEGGWVGEGGGSRREAERWGGPSKGGSQGCFMQGC